MSKLPLVNLSQPRSGLIGLCLRMIDDGVHHGHMESRLRTGLANESLMLSEPVPRAL
jgi:hypothetical protein